MNLNNFNTGGRDFNTVYQELFDIEHEIYISRFLIHRERFSKIMPEINNGDPEMSWIEYNEERSGGQKINIDIAFDIVAIKLYEELGTGFIIVHTPFEVYFKHPGGKIVLLVEDEDADDDSDIYRMPELYTLPERIYNELNTSEVVSKSFINKLALAGIEYVILKNKYILFRMNNTVHFRRLKNEK